ncbi:hypothetical protein E5720_11740 [Rhodococcus sp. PAMC28707]|uniref:hypothetical protein n=1 Tax=unclassified Rhodococcus (in: high G+C Gram-positive bacteria) TaxID=192944 RepID=UPI00109DE6F5|nr:MULTISPECIES: hypothetical protein [unclassified Rhodococcus (in: high G+C Gram-positive bacteria)]QCB49242.1 hypothetical protein E5769_02275 [Rhodococcus sp. PAMC28705]QCB59070.1 hypothetical protein E5720_11740 [Rhodococcus sp. PAMC28707]
MWSVTESESARTEWPESPPPPWPAEVKATIWWHRARPAGRALQRGRTIPITLVMVIDYLNSPVGPYREILASPVLQRPGRGMGPMPRISVPFIAVDSETSVHGGRTHWHLPKVLAEFGGEVLADASVSGEGATGDGWSVSTQAKGIGPSFPIKGALGFAQPSDEGSLLATARLTGKARLARVQVAASGPSLGEWIAPGTHFGLQIVSGRMATGPSSLLSGGHV